MKLVEKEKAKTRFNALLDAQKRNTLKQKYQMQGGKIGLTYVQKKIPQVMDN